MIPLTSSTTEKEFWLNPIHIRNFEKEKGGGSFIRMIDGSTFLVNESPEIIYGHIYNWNEKDFS